LFLVLSWLLFFSSGKRIGLYCSDVQGAFDRVSTERLLKRLTCCRIHPQFLAVLKSWLQERKASVVVGGAKSEEFSMSNMVYQGTVLGPPLWNVFFCEAPLTLAAL